MDVALQVAALKGTNAYDSYRALVSRLLKGGRASVLQEPELPDMEELLASVEEDGDLDLWVYSLHEDMFITSCF